MDPNNLTLAYALIVVGFLLLAAELFIPTSGVLFVASVACVAGGVVMAFYHDVSVGLVTLIAVFVALPVVGGVLLHYWPKTPMGRRFFLAVPDEDATVASLADSQEMAELRGQLGQAQSALRPAGVVDFNGRRVDCLTEGIMVERGQWVRCIEVRPGRVIVRPVEHPKLPDLETADFD